MSPRGITESFAKSARKMLSTPPTTWYRQWRRRNRTLPASRHLRSAGVFTFFSATFDALPQRSPDAVHDHFSGYRAYNFDNLSPPPDCQYWSGSKMLVPVCVK